MSSSDPLVITKEQFSLLHRLAMLPEASDTAESPLSKIVFRKTMTTPGIAASILVDTAVRHSV